MVIALFASPVVRGDAAIVGVFVLGLAALGAQLAKWPWERVSRWVTALCYLGAALLVVGLLAEQRLVFWAAVAIAALLLVVYGIALLRRKQGGPVHSRGRLEMVKALRHELDQEIKPRIQREIFRRQYDGSFASTNAWTMYEEPLRGDELFGADVAAIHTAYALAEWRNHQVQEAYEQWEGHEGGAPISADELRRLEEAVEAIDAAVSALDVRLPQAGAQELWVHELMESQAIGQGIWNLARGCTDDPGGLAQRRSVQKQAVEWESVLYDKLRARDPATAALFRSGAEDPRAHTLAAETVSFMERRLRTLAEIIRSERNGG